MLTFEIRVLYTDIHTQRAFIVCSIFLIGNVKNLFRGIDAFCNTAKD